MDMRPHHTRRLMELGVLLTGVLLVLAVAIAQEVGRPPPGVGEPAPDFTLRGATGAEFRLSSLRGARRALLMFYPKDMTSG